MVDGNPLGDPLTRTAAPKPREGYLYPMSGPGLGVVMNEAAVREMAAR